MSNLIHNNAIVENEWITVTLPAGEEIVRKQAGKVVLFKLTGEQACNPEQIAATVIPASGKIIVPLPVWQARKQELAPRLAKGELGIWLATHEVLETLIDAVDDINQLPIIAIYVERFADGRIFSIGNLLRTRYGYKNELRAFGDVLRDQLFFLKRCGFDSYQIRADRSAEDALASLQDFSKPYQGAVDETQPVWRRAKR
ncbi:MAG: hypothetical protein CVU35_07675 [Betaproteobacteria bacterium HGW-Betaproteobacteria-8]|nr:MAG: hypothetical protein CVU35_07675 [Betaproteobacteria bacterium HGW-Betaproteobacteria-8]